MAQSSNIPYRVYVGILWLDSQFPDWYMRINLDTLDMQDSRFCILGQLYGAIKPHEDMTKYGFDVAVNHYDEMQMEFFYLNTEWERQIFLRRKESCV
jgi:hypothetical protein